MMEQFDSLEKTSAETNGDIRVAIALVKEEMASKKVLIEDYQLDNLDVDSYMPFMNFLQHRDYEKVRRYLLIHPQAVSGGQWSVAGNGVHPENVFGVSNSRLRYILLPNSMSILSLRDGRRFFVA